jgi:xanthine dehydrogenase accessory factor
MKEILDDIDRWLAAGKRVALARVVNIEGSGPREPGAAMAVSEDGEVAGSVSGGCVEGAVVGEALAVLGSERPTAKLVTFGYSDDEAFAVGLTCGGIIHLFIEPLDWQPIYELVRDGIRNETPIALATVLDGPNAGGQLLLADGTVGVTGSLGDADLDRVVERDARAELEAGRTGVRHYGPHGEATPEDLHDTPTIRVFVESWAPPPQMWIFGAVDFTAALARIAKVLGYRVTVCDAREVFATRRRFPTADHVIVSWPQNLFAERGASLSARDAVCVLTHDAKFDVPAVRGALSTKVGYIGVMGSRTTHAKRMERLAEVGVTDPGDIARLMSPIGLDIGARSPEETAISICAEIIAARTGRTVPSLRQSAGPIHG